MASYVTSSEIEDTYSQDYGMCYTFKFRRPTTNSGRNFGLSFIFNLEVFDYLGLFTMAAGLKMFVTHRDNNDGKNSSFVDWSNELNLPPGFDHSVSVHPMKMEKLAAPYSDCASYGEGSLASFENKEDCQFKCEQK